jgi:ABC-2 type transport system ATP-binding protein
MICAEHLTRRFGSRTVVQDLSLDVRRSEIVALLGPNGAGKTTTMRMLAGLVAPTSGTVTLGGARLTRASGPALRQRIGFLTETPGLWDRLTVRENLTVFAHLYGVEPRKVDGLLDLLDLSAHVTKRAAELSRGMRQKVALARALLHEPQVLLLDEPTSGLDPEISRSVRHQLERLRDSGCAILVSTHNLDEAERIADRVAVLQQRLIALDTPASLRRRLTTGRVVVRLATEAAPWIDAARRLGAQASADGQTLTVALPPDGADIPSLVRALVGLGADILEVRPEMPALEDVYLRLVADERQRVPA